MYMYVKDSNRFKFLRMYSLSTVKIAKKKKNLTINFRNNSKRKDIHIRKIVADFKSRKSCGQILPKIRDGWFFLVTKGIIERMRRRRKSRETCIFLLQGRHLVNRFNRCRRLHADDDSLQSMLDDYKLFIGILLLWSKWWWCLVVKGVSVVFVVVIVVYIVVGIVVVVVIISTVLYVCKGDCHGHGGHHGLWRIWSSWSSLQLWSWCSSYSQYYVLSGAILDN